MSSWEEDCAVASEGAGFRRRRNAPAKSAIGFPDGGAVSVSQSAGNCLSATDHSPNFVYPSWKIVADATIKQRQTVKAKPKPA